VNLPGEKAKAPSKYKKKMVIVLLLVCLIILPILFIVWVFHVQKQAQLLYPIPQNETSETVVPQPEKSKA
jgi:flagellar basal body-associated protein FliL